jgi:4-azaleucine resistance transporter AzlC
MGMSLFVFAGSAQFVATTLLASGTSTALIILTTFVINLRHTLYATTLAPYIKNLPQRWVFPLAFWLTDESFVVVVSRYGKNDSSPYKHWYYLGSAVFMYLNWNLCTFIGIVAGQRIQNPQQWGLDFAMIATFIGMLIPFVKNRPALISVSAAAITAVLANGLPNKLGLIAAALVGVVAGLIAESRQDSV